MRVTNRELHGIDAPLDEQIELKAGGFSAIFEPARGYLRQVRIGGIESVRNIYFHARRTDWGTVVPVVTNLRRKIGKDQFELTWTATHREGDIDFVWHGTLTGTRSGIYYVADGVALRQFETNRTGMCVLIPREFQGLKAEVEHPDGSHRSVVMPKLISRTEPLHKMRVLEIGPAKLTFEGDTFSAEDQRNWSDASFKAYSMNGNRTVLKGEKIRHAVRIESHPAASSTGGVPGEGAPFIERPKFGAILADDHTDLSGLPLDFLRVELVGEIDRDQHMLDHARSSGLQLHVVAREGKLTPSLRDTEILISKVDKASQIARHPTWLDGGSFDSFNFGRHEARGFDGIEVSLTPQVHTFDERSILENTETLEDIVSSLQAIAPGLPVGLNVRMKAAGSDPRLQSLFGAQWIFQCCVALCLQRNVRITFGTVDDLRYPAIVALLNELLEWKSLGVGFKARVGVTRLSDRSVLFGNSRPIPRIVGQLPIDFTSADILSSSGWLPIQYRARDRQPPYAIIRAKRAPNVGVRVN